MRKGCVKAVANLFSSLSKALAFATALVTSPAHIVYKTSVFAQPSLMFSLGLFHDIFSDLASVIGVVLPSFHSIYNKLLLIKISN